MTPDLENLTADEAYERMIWCEATVKKLRELSPRKVRAWWEKECVRPEWLECLPAAREKLHQFAERLEEEVYRWAEAASSLYAEEDAVKAEEREETRKTMQRALGRKQGLLEQLRRCQSIPEPERLESRSELWFCGHAYLMEVRQWVRRGNSTFLESYPTPLFKIGRTKRWWKERIVELERKGLRSVTKYATVVPVELEQALHAHYDHFRVRRKEREKGQRKNIRGELFWLPPDEIDRFKEVVAKVERWVLVAVEARLELEIMRLEAALLRMQQ